MVLYVCRASHSYVFPLCVCLSLSPPPSFARVRAPAFFVELSVCVSHPPFVIILSPNPTRRALLQGLRGHLNTPSDGVTLNRTKRMGPVPQKSSINQPALCLDLAIEGLGQAEPRRRRRSQRRAARAAQVHLNTPRGTRYHVPCRFG